MKKERRGDYQGKTVQVVPHLTDEIQRRIEQSGNTEVTIVEIGGTVGDIESIPFLEAIRQFGQNHHCLYIHLTLILQVGQELKTKPTQHSVRNFGPQASNQTFYCVAQPSDEPDLKEKLSLLCDVEKQCVVDALDIKKSIYEIPVLYQQQGLDTIILNKLGLKKTTLDLKAWKTLYQQCRTEKERLEIGVVGKYIHLEDAYKSVYEALSHGGLSNQVEVHIPKDRL